MSPSFTDRKTTRSSSNGKRFLVRYVYMDVVVKRDGKWQIVASQLAKAAADKEVTE